MLSTKIRFDPPKQFLLVSVDFRCDVMDGLKDNEDELNIEEALQIRHRRERKELQARVQALKKSADKGDKKRKREVLDGIVKLELALEQRHSEELEQLTTCTKTIENGILQVEHLSINDDKQTAPTERVSKAQKRRDKKAQADREKEIEINAQEELNKTGPRMVEIQTLKSILNSRQLQLHPIPSDGDCLYNAVRHQLMVTGHQPLYDTPTLRCKTAEYISSNKDSLIYYMTNPSNGDILNEVEFERYCSAIRSTPAWGGQIEIKALSQVLKAPIEVLQASGPPTIQNEDNFSGPTLIITYHRFMYSLGEHYNSTQPLGIIENDEQSTTD